MSILKNIILAIALTMMLAGLATAQLPDSQTVKPNAVNQSANALFRSGGGFKIDLPKVFTSSKEQSFNDGKLSGHGKSYFWEKPQEYRYWVDYYKLENGKKVLTEIEKNTVVQNYKKNFLQELQTKNLPFIEKKYAFNGNNGVEIQSINSAGGTKMITRFFVAGNRFFFIGLIFYLQMIDDSQVLQIADSFALLDAKSLVEAKIEESTPAALPQEPAVVKLKTDAQDNHLNGKVKTVIEDTQEKPTLKRERFSEAYYDEKGNLVKEMSFDEGYPDSVTLWGYIDGNRVNSTGSIDFDDDQRPPPRDFSTKATMEDDSNLPRDSRYDIKYNYKYNEAGQLVEKTTYQNNGKLSNRVVFNYKENQREELYYGYDGSEWSRTIEILDKDGNVIERRLMSADDKAEIWINTYELDSQGNWIVQKTFEKKIVKGKLVLKPLWVSYRTIAYYP